MGKGDKQRRGNSEKLISNWDRIFGENKVEGNTTSNIEPFHISNARSLKLKDIKYKEKIAKEKLKKQKELFDRLDKEVQEEDRKGKQDI